MIFPYNKFYVYNLGIRTKTRLDTQCTYQSISEYEYNNWVGITKPTQKI